MGKIKLYFKYMTGNRIIAALTIVILGYVESNIISAIVSDANGKIVQPGNYSIQLANITNAAYIYISLFFLLAVFFTFRIKNANLDELHYQLYSKSRNFHIVSLNVVNVLCVVIFAMIHIIIASTRFNMDGVFAIYIMKRYALCYLLPTALVIIWGCMIGRIRNVLLLWGACIAVLLIYSPFALGLYERYTQYNSSMRAVCYNFDIIQNNINGCPGFDTDATYLYKWLKIIGMISTSLLLYLVIYKRKFAKYIAVVFIAIFIIGEAYYYIPDSKALDQENWCSNNSYYNNKNKFKESDADFIITKYDMDVKFGKTLKVDCTVTIDNPRLNELYFTLYHTFDIYSITNAAGEKVEYERNGDYLTIDNSEHSDTFLMSYSGKTEFYISNEKYIYLPQNYAYYPLSGFKNMNKYHQYLKANNDYEADFDISVNVNDIYSNLEKDENNHFVGKTAGPLFVKGDLQEISIEEYRFVLPRYMPDATLTDRKALTALIDYFEMLEKENNHYNFKDKTIYILYYCGGIVCADAYHKDYVDLPSANIESIKRLFSQTADQGVKIEK